jgi:hypothetical protein
MPVFNCDLTADAGADLIGTSEPWVVNYAPVDLTGRTARMYIYRHSYDESPFLSLTGTLTASGQVTTGGVAGTVSWYVRFAANEGLPQRIGPLKYAIFVDDPGPIAAINVTNGGSGYTSAPTVSITGGGGSNATATATVENGAVTAVTVTDPGYGYSSGVSVSFSGGGGTSAAASAVVVPIQTTLFQSGRYLFSNAYGA